MTRDEAMRLVRDSGPIGGTYKPYDEAIVDALSALGILKLDEPKSAQQKFADLAYEFFGADGYLKLWNRLEQDGIRIVEK